MAERIRIAHVITRMCRGGAQENTFDTVRLADADRFEAHLIAGPPLGAEGSMEDRVAAAGIPIIRAPHLRRAPHPVHDLRALAELTALLRAGRFDLVHTHTSKAGFIARLAARRAGVPAIVHTPHGHVFGGYFSRATTACYAGLERYAARFTDRIVALTEAEIDAHLARGIGRRAQYRAIFSGIDLAPYTAAHARRAETRAELGLNDGEIAVAAVGRLEPVKGLDYFIKAAHLVTAAKPNVRFFIVGEGALRESLERQAAPLGNRIAFMGYRNDVPAVMAAIDILALPSLNEGMGRVLLQAAAAGTPAVASQVGGVGAVVRHGETGLLTPPRDAEALADALVRLAGDAALRLSLGDEARAAAPRFSAEAMVRQLEALYEDAIGETKREPTP